MYSCIDKGIVKKSSTYSTNFVESLQDCKNLCDTIEGCSAIYYLNEKIDKDIHKPACGILSGPPNEYETQDIQIGKHGDVWERYCFRGGSDNKLVVKNDSTSLADDPNPPFQVENTVIRGPEYCPLFATNHTVSITFDEQPGHFWN